ncbi:MAG TPA: hypothetical protein VMK84_12355 [Streptosporangiaceae bacterium]|nr:hypothetical protein [Streptosporangiaceae bacterium]
MNLDEFPLSAFEVDCDGSACGSGNVGRHIHAPQDGLPAIAGVKVRNSRREAYSEATGITRLVSAPGTGDESEGGGQ